MILKRIEIVLCEACLDGIEGECHVPECAWFLHDSPGHPILPELYEVKKEWEAEL